MPCPRCGNDLAPGSAFCSVCGHSLATGGPALAMPPAAPLQSSIPPARPFEPSRLSVLAISGFVLAFVLPPVGLVLSILGRSECARSRGVVEGEGFAIAGIVISVVTTFLMVMTAVFVATVFHEFFALFR